MKQIKDPIYGYINVEDYFVDILDTASFQRLRNIVQTSYTSIYPSALHNRFTHSLGVYHLGKLAFENLLKNKKYTIEDNELSEIRKVFLLACFLHDFGHAPFSHTTEKFFSTTKGDDNSTPKIYIELYETIGGEYDVLLKQKPITKIGKEHEVMSALLALKMFGDVIGKEWSAFFANCIIGKKTKGMAGSDAEELKYACIELLNSSIIDVDKLDYLIRDSYMSGFYSIEIDFERLLGGLVSQKEYPYVAYKKKSISVIESVILAHDMERKWIQSHPVIMYETFLIETTVRILEKTKNKEGAKLFSFDALTETGVNLGNENICLLSDYDILYMAKRIKGNEGNECIEQFFSRKKRLKPLWKSEAEYRSIFNAIFKDEQNRKFVDWLEGICKTIEESDSSIWQINQKLLDKYSKDLDELKEIQKTNSSQTISSKISKIEQIISFIKELKEFSDKNGCDFKYVIITQSQFISGLNKDVFKDLKITLDDSSDLKKLNEVSNILEKLVDDKFFYIYLNQNKLEYSIKKELIDILKKYALKI